VINLQLPKAERDHDRRQDDAEGDEQSLLDPDYHVSRIIA
jgi:hypothetical protein